MAARVLIADRSSTIIGEIEPDLGGLSWRLNDVGKVLFNMSMKDSKATEDYLRFGNRLLVEFDNGLPNWGGVIDPPRKWAGGIISCTAYSGEYLFGLRQTDKGRYFSGATVGYIYQALIEEANAIEDMQIDIGEIWQGGDSHSPEYHYKDILTIFKDSLCYRLSTADFNVSASMSAGKIILTANLYERRGSDKVNVALVEGANVSAARLSEQGPIVNSWDMAGEGMDWGDDRITSHEDDTSSMSEYGLREGCRIYADVSVQATLDTHAENALADSKDPYNMLELEVTDDDPGQFADYDVGDSVQVQLYSYGFEGYEHLVRIMAREYDPGKGICRLVVQQRDVVSGAVIIERNISQSDGVTVSDGTPTVSVS